VNCWLPRNKSTMVEPSNMCNIVYEMIMSIVLNRSDNAYRIGLDAIMCIVLALYNNAY
jgi:hypothetical protein